MKKIYVIMLLASFYSASAMDRIIRLAPSAILYYRLEDLGHGDFAKETHITLLFGELEDTLGNIIYRLEHALFCYSQTYRQKANNNRMANFMLNEQPKILDALLRKPTQYELDEQKLLFLAQLQGNKS